MKLRYIVEHTYIYKYILQKDDCSTHFSRLTSLSQWMPRGTNPGDEGCIYYKDNDVHL